MHVIKVIGTPFPGNSNSTIDLGRSSDLFFFSSPSHLTTVAKNDENVIELTATGIAQDLHLIPLAKITMANVYDFLSFSK